MHHSIHSAVNQVVPAAYLFRSVCFTSIATELPMSNKQTYIEIRANLAAARISVEDAADRAWQADDEEFSNWLNHIANQLDDALDCIEVALLPEPVRLLGG